MSDASFLLPLAIGAGIAAVSALFAAFLCSAKYCPAFCERQRQRRREMILLRECREVQYTDTASEGVKHFENCAVCLERFREQERLTLCPCQHLYHRACLVSWLETASSCPVCKVPVSHTASALCNDRTPLI